MVYALWKVESFMAVSDDVSLVLFEFNFVEEHLTISQLPIWKKHHKNGCLFQYWISMIIQRVIKNWWLFVYKRKLKPFGHVHIEQRNEQYGPKNRNWQSIWEGYKCLTDNGWVAVMKQSFGATMFINKLFNSETLGFSNSILF